jgi:hypothetical protein
MTANHDQAAVHDGMPAQKRVDSAEARTDIERRRFLSRAGLTAFVGGASAVLPNLSSGASAAQGEVANSSFDVSTGRNSYRWQVYRAAKLRSELAQDLAATPVAAHPSNGDETRYPNYIGTDTRGLAHNQRGLVDRNAYRLALEAYRSGDPDDFEAIPLSGTRKQVNPIGTVAISLTGLDVAQFGIPPAPALSSLSRAAEAVELYWQALLRDVPFREYRDDTRHAGILAAVAELNALSDFQGPRSNGKVAPSTLFRGTALYLDPSDSSTKTGYAVVPPGILDGPYVSQFLLRDIPYGTQFISARLRVPTSDSEFLTNLAEWLLVQNGNLSGKAVRYQSDTRYIATGRDLAEYVHGSAAAFWAAPLLLSESATSSVPGFGTPLAPSNPYLRSKTQAGAAGSFALGYFQGLLPLVQSRAIRAAYWQKWFVHRTLRPEAYGGLVHDKIVNSGSDHPLALAIVNSRAVAEVFRKNGTYLLPHAFPEGAPIHSAYPSGAAVVAAASVTLLKAFYDEKATIPNPVQPSTDDPRLLVPYAGAPLTVGGELNKLAAHHGIGRAWAGIHWRSDVAASLALGEKVAIGLLREERQTFREKFDGFTFTKFDGTLVTI